MNKYPQSELFEKLADIEHQRWADWQKYMHSKCAIVENEDGEKTIVIPQNLFEQWERQIATVYLELSEKEKDSDRDQVMRYWKLIYPDEV